MKSGIELSHIKTSVRPQDDLYRHMNGTWIDSAQIPADRSSDGAFYELFQNAEKQVREIIEELGAREPPPAELGPDEGAEEVGAGRGLGAVEAGVEVGLQAPRLLLGIVSVEDVHAPADVDVGLRIGLEIGRAHV